MKCVALCKWKIASEDAVRGEKCLAGKGRLIYGVNTP